MERASVGSATSSGRGLTWLVGSVACLVALFCFFFFDFEGEKNRGEKQDVGTAQEGWIHEGGSMQNVEVWRGREDEFEFIKVGLKEQRRERSKSESMMCPSSRTRMFSGFRSR